MTHQARIVSNKSLLEKELSDTWYEHLASKGEAMYQKKKVKALQKLLKQSEAL